MRCSIHGHEVPCWECREQERLQREYENSSLELQRETARAALAVREQQEALDDQRARKEELRTLQTMAKAAAEQAAREREAGFRALRAGLPEFSSEFQRLWKEVVDEKRRIEAAVGRLKELEKQLRGSDQWIETSLHSVYCEFRQPVQALLDATDPSLESLGPTPTDFRNLPSFDIARKLYERAQGSQAINFPDTVAGLIRLLEALEGQLLMLDLPKPGGPGFLASTGNLLLAALLSVFITAAYSLVLYLLDPALTCLGCFSLPLVFVGVWLVSIALWKGRDQAKVKAAIGRLLAVASLGASLHRLAEEACGSTLKVDVPDAKAIAALTSEEDCRRHGSAVSSFLSNLRHQLFKRIVLAWSQVSRPNGNAVAAHEQLLANIRAMRHDVATAVSSANEDARRARVIGLHDLMREKILEVGRDILEGVRTPGMSVATARCPSCGGSIGARSRCEYCGSVYRENAVWLS